MLDLILSAVISSNVFQTDDDKVWATVARLVPSSSLEEVVLITDCSMLCANSEVFRLLQRSETLE